eukprot:scaffold539_cov186-Alexandrium_tamarense.AAC.3
MERLVNPGKRIPDKQVPAMGKDDQTYHHSSPREEDGSRKRESTHGAEGFEAEEDDEDKESHEQLLKRRNRSLLSSNGAPLIWTGSNNSVSDTANVAASRNTVSGAGDSGVRVDEGCDSLNNDLLDPSLDSYLDEFLDN